MHLSQRRSPHRPRRPVERPSSLRPRRGRPRRAGVADCPVRVQWDPDRSIHLEAQPWRAIQVGLSGEAVDRYVDHWIVDMADVTELARSTHSAVLDGRAEEALRQLPTEHPYPLPGHVRRRLGADG
ncbi:DUF4291 family protein [Streptomyces mirabilis]|uniref:DUF4291 family protein n=1 Tax=Streptomyces mirabilis TaxID=68239 RepID=UPI00332FBB29